MKARFGCAAEASRQAHASESEALMGSEQICLTFSLGNHVVEDNTSITQLLEFKVLTQAKMQWCAVIYREHRFPDAWF